jgi:hypothetical protein
MGENRHCSCPKMSRYARAVGSRPWGVGERLGEFWLHDSAILVDRRQDTVRWGRPGMSDAPGAAVPEGPGEGTGEDALDDGPGARELLCTVGLGIERAADRGVVGDLVTGGSPAGLRAPHSPQPPLYLISSSRVMFHKSGFGWLCGAGRARALDQHMARANMVGTCASAVR